MTGEMAIGDRAANNIPRRADPYLGIEAALAELAQTPSSSEAARVLRQQLISRCLPLAEHIARRYTGRGATYDDLFQTANSALASSIDRFDPGLGQPFVAFAVPTVLGAVRRRYREPTFALGLARSVQEFQVLIRPTVDAMTRRLARVPTAMEIAVQLDVDLLEVTRALLAGYSRRIGAAAPDITDEVVDDSEYEVDDSEYEVMEKLVAARLLAELSEAERWVVYLRFFRHQPHTQIAEQLGISPMQVSRLLSSALAGIRETGLRPEAL